MAAGGLAHAPIITLPGYANALFRTGAGADPGESREAGIERVDPGLRGLRDVVPAVPTTMDDITYLRQSTRAGNPGAVTEPATAVEPGLAAAPQPKMRRPVLPHSAMRLNSLRYWPK